MLPINIDMGAGLYVNATLVAAIIDYYPEIASKLTVPVKPGQTAKSVIITTTGNVIPAYRAANILARRWKEVFEEAMR